MTREEAIKLLEPGGKFPDFPHKLEDVDEACRMAISALRNQTHKEVETIEGMCCDCVFGKRCCDYSENKECGHYKEDGSCWIPYPPVKLDRSRWEECSCCCKNLITSKIWISDGKQYCPYCGKPLTEQAWAELERKINRR